MDDAEAVVRLRLLAVEFALRMERYQMLMKSQLSLEDRIKVLTARPPDGELAQVKRALQETQSDMGAVKKRLVELESEKAKLSRVLGKPPGAAPAGGDYTLNKILDRLSAIEKRLEKLERRK